MRPAQPHAASPTSASANVASEKSGARVHARIMSRSCGSQLPQSPPMPQRSSESIEAAPASIARLTSRSLTPRHIQMIIDRLPGLVRRPERGGPDDLD